MRVSEIRIELERLAGRVDRLGARLAGGATDRDRTEPGVGLCEPHVGRREGWVAPDRGFERIDAALKVSLAATLVIGKPPLEVALVDLGRNATCCGEPFTLRAGHGH